MPVDSALGGTDPGISAGSAPDPAGGAYSAPQISYLDLRGLLLREGRRRRGEWEGKTELGGEGGNGQGRGERGREPQGLVDSPMFEILKNTLYKRISVQNRRFRSNGGRLTQTFR